MNALMMRIQTGNGRIIPFYYDNVSSVYRNAENYSEYEMLRDNVCEFNGFCLSIEFRECRGASGGIRSRLFPMLIHPDNIHISQHCREHAVQNFH